jgi:tetratricopeptide (TPR) repeat protein
MSWQVKTILVVIGAVMAYGLFSLFQPDPPKPGEIRTQEDFQRVYGEALDQALPVMAEIEAGNPMTTQHEATLRSSAEKLENVTKFEPSDFRPFVILARIWLTLGEDEATKRAYEQAELNLPDRIPDDERSDYAEIYYGFADVGYKLLDLEKAKAQVEKARELAPNPKYDLLLARILVQQEKFPEAKEILTGLQLDADYGKAAEDLLGFIRDAQLASSESGSTPAGNAPASNAP